MGWVTMIGPSDGQVEYRLSGGHGCGKSLNVDAAPLVEAIEKAAETAGVTVAALVDSKEARRTFFRARAQLRDAAGAKISGFDAVELAAAAGIDPEGLYGDAVLPSGARDGQLDYHLDATERPLIWTGNGLTEFRIQPGSVLSPAQFQEARRLMRGEDPRTGKTLVEPKLAVAPAAKLPVAPLVRAIRRAAAERGVPPASLLDSARKRDDFRRMENQLRRHGESHRAPVSKLAKLGAATGVEIVGLYGEDTVEKAFVAESGGLLDARPLLRAVEERAALLSCEPGDLFTSASAKRRFGQVEREAGRRTRDLPMDVRDAVALAKAAGVDSDAVWDIEEVKAALLQGRVEVGNRGADVTLDLPKSQSVLLAYADDEVARSIEGIYTAAGREAIGALESWTSYAMRGRHGDGKEADTIATSGFSGWMMIHRAARPVGDVPYGDPHFHLHFTLANMVKGADGEWSTMAAGGRDLHRHTRATQALMNARIRRELGREFGIVFRRAERTGAWEIGAIPEATIGLFSKRDSQVRQLLAQLGLDYETATLRERTAASAVSKAAKNGEATVEDDALRAYWQAEGRAAGDDPATIAAAATQHTPEANPDLDELCRVVFDPDSGLTSHAKSFTHAAAIAAVLDALPFGVENAQQAETLTNAVLGRAGYAVELRPQGPQHFAHADRYTTADVVAAEAAIVSETTRRLGEQAAVLDNGTVEMTLSAVEAQHGSGFHFSEEQQDVLTRLLTAGHGVEAVVGAAGAGKTTIMDTARQAWESRGLVVAGASTAAVAAANLKAEAGIASRTMASWLMEVRRGGAGLRGVDILVVDEAAMCDDREVAELLAHAAETGTKIVGIGDPKQLHSPGIGGSFAAVHQLVGGLTLSQNYRQRDAVERRALALWRDEERVEALRTYAGTGRVHALADKDATLAAMLTLWADKRAAYSDDHDAVQQLVMLASSNDTVDELNTGARAILKDSGEVTGPDHLYSLPGGRELALALGDHVLVRANDYRSRRSGGAHDDVLNGYRGIVRTVDEQRRVLVEWREKTPDGTKDTAEWVDADYIAQGGLSLGYAITGHKSQGLTVQDALVYGPGAQANALYTMLSRDKGEAHLFLPLSVYETDSGRARAGAPVDEQDQIDRAVAGLIREIEKGADERMVLTDLPNYAVPEHVRALVKDLLRPETPDRRDGGVETERSRAAAPEAEEVKKPERGRGYRYGHLDGGALRRALGKAGAATRATARAATEAGEAADRAERQAAAGLGPSVLAVRQRVDFVRERAEAIRELRSATERRAVEIGTLSALDAETSVSEKKLAATRFGRPLLRGADREAVEEERAALCQARSEAAHRAEGLDMRLNELEAASGPREEHDTVLAEAAQPSEAELCMAQRSDEERAQKLRADVAKAEVVARSAAWREAQLREEHARRGRDPQPTEADVVRPGPRASGARVDEAALEPVAAPEPPAL